jgi:hypothetical protein
MQTNTIPQADPGETPIKVQIGQLLEIATVGAHEGRKIRITHDGLFEALVDEHDGESGVTLHAECRSCQFTAQADSDDDQSGFEYRCWNHEQQHPGHVIGYRTETVRWWE